jgi:hypothetical protein
LPLSEFRKKFKRKTALFLLKKQINSTLVVGTIAPKARVFCFGKNKGGIYKWQEKE